MHKLAQQKLDWKYLLEARSWRKFWASPVSFYHRVLAEVRRVRRPRREPLHLANPGLCQHGRVPRGARRHLRRRVHRSDNGVVTRPRLLGEHLRVDGA